MSYIFSALDVILLTLPWNPAEVKGGELTSEALGGDPAAVSVSVSCLLRQSCICFRPYRPGPRARHRIVVPSTLYLGAFLAVYDIIFKFTFRHFLERQRLPSLWATLGLG